MNFEHNGEVEYLKEKNKKQKKKRTKKKRLLYKMNKQEEQYRETKSNRNFRGE